MNKEIKKGISTEKKFFSDYKIITRGDDGWLAPDGIFFVSNELGEKQFHTECADFIFRSQKDAVMEKLRRQDVKLDKDDESNLPARTILGFANYLLISHGMPQYGYISGELTPIQIGALANAGFELPKNADETFKRKLPNREQIMADIKAYSLPEPEREGVLKEINRLYVNPGVGVAFSNIGHFVGNTLDIKVDFDYAAISRKLFLAFAENSVVKEVCFDIDRAIGGVVNVRYKELGDGLAVVLEEKSHSLNERIEMNLKDFVIEDFWVYIQTLDWITNRYASKKR